MSMRSSRCKERGRWRFHTGSAVLWLAFVAAVLQGCDNGLTGGAAEPFRVDVAFLVSIPQGRGGPEGEWYLWSLDGREELIEFPVRCEPTAAAISSDGSRIALTVCNDETGRDIVVGEIRSGSLRYIARSADMESTPRWSPDGGRIAYLAEGDFGSILRIAELDAETTITAAIAPGRMELGDWSPDGAGFLCVIENGVRIVDAGGGGSALISGMSGVKRGPVWSPGGDSVGFLLDGRIRIIDRDGTGGRTIETGVDSLVPPLRWTVDGAHFIVSARDGARSDILRIARTTGEVTNLTGSVLGGSSPVLLPDGRQIAYLANLGVVTKVYLMDLDGYANRPLTPFNLEESLLTARTPRR